PAAKKGAWGADEEEQLRAVYEEYKQSDGDIVENILSHLTNTSRSRRQVVNQLVKMGLVEDRKTLRKKRKPGEKRRLKKKADQSIPLLVTVGPDKGPGQFLLLASEAEVNELGPRLSELMEGKGGGKKKRFQGKHPVHPLGCTNASASNPISPAQSKSNNRKDVLAALAASRKGATSSSARKRKERKDRSGSGRADASQRAQEWRMALPSDAPNDDSDRDNNAELSKETKNLSPRTSSQGKKVKRRVQAFTDSDEEEDVKQATDVHTIGAPKRMYRVLQDDDRDHDHD
ncbi:predicted protein, partial [Nematostella vectensis]